MLTVAVGAAALWAAPPVKNLVATATFPEESNAAVQSEPITGSINSIGAFGGTVTSPATFVTQVILPDFDIATRECLTAPLAKCNPEGPLQSGVPLALNSFQIGVKAILDNDPDFDDRPGGLTGMACNTPSSALVNYTLYIAGTEGHWGLNANPRYHANAASVTRTGKTTWVVTAVGYAELISFGHSGFARKGAGPSHEGWYTLPFQIEIMVPNAPAGANCS
jgi:hypothetical protein